MTDFKHYSEDNRMECILALKKYILMGYEAEQPLPLNNGDKLHLVYTEDSGVIGVGSKLYHELFGEALKFARMDAVRILWICDIYFNDKKTIALEELLKGRTATDDDGNAIVLPFLTRPTTIDVDPHGRVRIYETPPSFEEVLGNFIQNNNK